MENAESSPTGRPLSEERAAISLDVVRLGILGTGYGLMFAASNVKVATARKCSAHSVSG
jgi:hypothetical protein